jgi:hypothetical protein
LNGSNWSGSTQQRQPVPWRGGHVADVRTSVVYEHLRNDRIGTA